MAVAQGGDTISDAASNYIAAGPTFPSRESAIEQVVLWLRSHISSSSSAEQVGAIMALRGQSIRDRTTLSAAYGERQYTLDVLNCVNRLGLDSSLRRTMLAILLPRDAYTAVFLHEELSAGKLTSILLSFVTDEMNMQQVADTHDSIYGFQSLSNLIENFRGGNFKKLLRERFCKQKVLLSRDDDVVMEDLEHLYDKAQNLYFAIKELPNSPKKRIAKILEGTTDESRKKIMEAYAKFSYSNNMETDLMTVTGGYLGNFHRGLLALMQSSVNRPKYYAQALAKALLGNPNQIDHETILSVITTRAKMDMKEIKIEFEREYRTSLHEAVYNAFSGHVCRDDLLLLLNWNDMN